MTFAPLPQPADQTEPLPTGLASGPAPAPAEQGGAPVKTAGRDLRLDFFRGIALFLIFIDHIPGNVLGQFTIRSLGFSDAAEVFIFVSGYTAALVYGGAILKRGTIVATAKIFYRVWQIYVAHIFIFLIYLALISFNTLNFPDQMFSKELRVAKFFTEPYIAVIRVLELRFQPAFLLYPAALHRAAGELSPRADPAAPAWVGGADPVAGDLSGGADLPREPHRIPGVSAVVLRPLRVAAAVRHRGDMRLSRRRPAVGHAAARPPDRARGGGRRRCRNGEAQLDDP
jgi:hypothetical protein